MNAVVYFSPTGGTKKIAEYAASYSGFSLIDLTCFDDRNRFDYTQHYEYIIFCFPVYSQNLPICVKEIMNNLNARYFILLATYGRMHMGNVLAEANNIQKGTIIGGAYIPTKHTYKEEEYFSDLSKLDSLLNRVKLKETNQVLFPNIKKNIFANFLPNLRSRLGVKIKCTDDCITCGLCNHVCPVNAIDHGIIKKNCIRCLSCYYNCPNKCLNVKYHFFLKAYLAKKKINFFLIY